MKEVIKYVVDVPGIDAPTKEFNNRDEAHCYARELLISRWLNRYIPPGQHVSSVMSQQWNNFQASTSFHIVDDRIFERKYIKTGDNATFHDREVARKHEMELYISELALACGIEASELKDIVKYVFRNEI